MSLERFVEELQDCNKVLYELDDVMTQADITDTSYYDFAVERIKTANTNATKASYFFFLVPNKHKADIVKPLVTTITRLRKTTRAMFLWTLKSRDALVSFIFEDGGEEIEVDLVTVDDIIQVYSSLCDSVDICSRLVVCEDIELVKSAKDRIINILDVVEEVFDMVNLIGFDPNQLAYLNGCLTDILKTIEKINLKANRRLGIDE